MYFPSFTLGMMLDVQETDEDQNIQLQKQADSTLISYHIL